MRNRLHLARRRSGNGDPFTAPTYEPCLTAPNDDTQASTLAGRDRKLAEDKADFAKIPA